MQSRVTPKPFGVFGGVSVTRRIRFIKVNY